MILYEVLREHKNIKGVSSNYGLFTADYLEQAIDEIRKNHPNGNIYVEEVRINTYGNRVDSDEGIPDFEKIWCKIFDFTENEKVKFDDPGCTFCKNKFFCHYREDFKGNEHEQT